MLSHLLLVLTAAVQGQVAEGYGTVFQGDAVIAAAPVCYHLQATQLDDATACILRCLEQGFQDARSGLSQFTVSPTIAGHLDHPFQTAVGNLAPIQLENAYLINYIDLNKKCVLGLSFCRLCKGFA